VSKSLNRLLALVNVVVMASCGGGDWSEYEPDPGVLPDDKVESAAYPTGPYGTQVGDKVENIVFEKAFFDPDTLCKGAKDLDLTRNRGVEPLSLHDLYRGDALCGKKKKQFVWLIASAGW
jgi:hypothetical protein